MGKKWILLFAFVLFGFGIVIINTSMKDKQQDIKFQDKQKVYEQDSPDDIREVYITIMPSKDQSKKYAHKLEELNEKKFEEIMVKVLFQEGDKESPRQGYFGYSLTDSNGYMELRGQSSKLLAKTLEQHSYRIKLDKGVGAWHGYKVINLNKHISDPIKIRNKLCFDLFKKIPGITSLRTQFVHLYIKDYSEGNFQEGYKDFGLYTQEENVDTNFLKNHGLDTKGWLYKVENFEFYLYPDQLMLKDNEDYNQIEFEKVLEIKGNDDHKKLIDMLKDVNNHYIHINQVIEEHFDRDNYITWLAVNMILGNIDNSSRNFYLYSPRNSGKWYFLPWDYDKALDGYRYSRGKKKNIESSRAEWQEGVSNYWGVVLHKRFLMNKNNRDDLSRKVKELSKIFSEENTEVLLDVYKPVVTTFLLRKPDILISADTEKRINEEFALITKIINNNKEIYYSSLAKPMPVFMGQPQRIGDYTEFKWDDSYDFQGDSIKYTIDISKSPEFDKIIYHKSDIKENEYVIKGLTKGRYYWKISIKDSKGNSQSSFEKYIDGNRLYYFGIQEFLLN